MRRQGDVVFRLLLALAISLAMPQLARAYTTLSIVPSFFTGKNANGSQVKAYDLPVTLSYHAKAWRVSITVPLLAVNGPGVLSAGSLYTVPRAFGTRVGLGDIWLEGSYTLDSPAGLRPAVLPYALIKLPTGARARGLGTGRTDYEAGTGLLWHWARFYPMARLGYRVVRNSHGYQWRDTVLAAGGVTYNFGRAGFATLEFERRGTGHHHQPPAETLFLSYTKQINPRLSVTAFGLHGFTFSSTDYGLGVGATMRF